MRYKQTYLKKTITRTKLKPVIILKAYIIIIVNYQRMNWNCGTMQFYDKTYLVWTMFIKNCAIQVYKKRIVFIRKQLFYLQ